MIKELSPRPWKRIANWVVDANGNDIAAVHGDDIKQAVQNAAAIVDGVNLYEGMLTLLRKNVARLETMDPHLSHWDEQWAREAKELIAKAEEN